MKKVVDEIKALANKAGDRIAAHDAREAELRAAERAHGHDNKGTGGQQTTYYNPVATPHAVQGASIQHAAGAQAAASPSAAPQQVAPPGNG